MAAEAALGRPIAVVTVCLNPGPILWRAIDSVEALADPRLTHIVIDGASSDGTVPWLEAQAARLGYWVSEPDDGIYDAMNKGWAAAPPDAYVLFIGADDRLMSLPSAEELLDAERAGCVIIHGVTTLGSRDFRSRLDRTILFRNTLHHQSLLIRKDAWPVPPFNPRYRLYGDWDFNIRLWRAGARAVQMSSLRAYASPGGLSSVRSVAESFRVASDNSGIAIGALAAALALLGRLRATRHPTG